MPTSTCHQFWPATLPHHFLITFNLTSFTFFLFLHISNLTTQKFIHAFPTKIIILLLHQNHEFLILLPFSALLPPKIRNFNTLKLGPPLIYSSNNVVSGWLNDQKLNILVLQDRHKSHNHYALKPLKHHQLIESIDRNKVVTIQEDIVGA